MAVLLVSLLYNGVKTLAVLLVSLLYNGVKNVVNKQKKQAFFVTKCPLFGPIKDQSKYVTLFIK